MSDQPVRMGYVGCGFVAQNIHIPNFASLPDCQLLALAEVREDLGQRVAVRYGIPRVYRSHQDLARDPEIEAVGVSAPYALQGRIAEDLLRAGKHVFMEKPMAVSTERARAILAAESAGGARLMVGYMKRYDPGNVRLKAHLDAWRASGECGRILLARNHGFCGNWVYQQDPGVPFERSSDAAPPSVDDCSAWLPDRWKGQYLGYLQQWTHNLNLLRYFLDDEAGEAKVEAVLLDSDGMTGLTVLHINGVRAVVESAGTRFHGWEEHTQIYFEGGWLKTDAPALMHKESSASVQIYRAGHDGEPPKQVEEYVRPGWSYREEVKHFVHGVRTGEPFRSSGRDTAADVRLYEEIYRTFLEQTGEL